MTALYKLRRCCGGATVLEFALVAPVFLFLLFAIVDGSRIFWLKKTIDEVAFSTARCMSISAACKEIAQQKSYAVQRAASYGVRIAADDVTLATNAICRSRAASNRVTIQAAFVSGTQGFLPLPSTLTATACFPVGS